MTEHIILKYKGVCHGGPWDGQQVNAEFPLIIDEGRMPRLAKLPNTSMNMVLPTMQN